MRRSRVAAPVFLVFALFFVANLLLAPPNPISSLSLSPTSVTGGTSSTGTVTLKQAAPTGGAVVSLTRSNPSAATVPPSVTVPAGQKTATFGVTTFAVATSTTVTVTASYSGGTQSATLTVAPPIVTGVSVSPTSVNGGTPATGTVTLTGPAPPSGANVTLSSSNPSAAAVPGTAVVAAGSTTATFGVTTFDVPSSTSVTFTAVYNGSAAYGSLTVTPTPVLSSVTLNPPTILAGAIATGTATLTNPAPTGGAVVTLSSSNTSAATVPGSITIQAGSTSANFNVTTLSVAADTTVTISASYQAMIRAASLTVIRSLTLTLDGGPGPIYTSYWNVFIRGHISPASAGPGTDIAGTLGAQNVTTTAAADGSFMLPQLNLAPGQNSITVTAFHSGSGQSAAPTTVVYVRDNVGPTATVNLLTQLPDPTNQATWTLAGTIIGYQGPTENAYVRETGGYFQAAIAQDGSWSGAYTLKEGFNEIGLTVRDLAGNTGLVLGVRTHLDSQGIRILTVLISNSDPAANPTGWPNTLDNLVSSRIYLATEETWTLKGSHLEAFLDEAGTAAGSQPPACGNDDLSCIVSRKAIPDLTRDFVDDTYPYPNPYLDLPKLASGVHNLRITVTDPFGVTTERGGEILVAWGLDTVPVANFAVPGVVTTRTPKLAGRTMQVNIPIDCEDQLAPERPSISYWDPAQPGSWKPLPVQSFNNPDGTYEIVPDLSQLPPGGIPITLNGTGQQVLRLSLSEPDATAGRLICDGSGNLISTWMLRNVRHRGGTRLVNEGIVDYDLPYRPAAQGDDPAPQIDTSGVQGIATETDGPYTHSVIFRVSDLNGDLSYRDVTVASSGCSSPDCTYAARPAADQKLATAQPGGYFAANVPLQIGTNDFSATARDDAGHIITRSFTINRSLTAVAAQITSPTSAGQTHRFCNPASVIFDASASLNRTSPQVPLRYQWTTQTGSLTSTQATYTETISAAGSRRVIVSSSAIPAPNPAASDPCSGAPVGQCSIAAVLLSPYSVPTGTIPNTRVLSPSNGALVRNDLPATFNGTVDHDSDPAYVYKWRLRRGTSTFYSIPGATGTGSDPAYAFSNRTLTLRLDSIPGLGTGSFTVVFDAAFQTPEGNCIAMQSSAIAGPITVTAGKEYFATGLSPGAVVTGESATRLYGDGFDTAAQVAISGPIYTLENTTTPLCTMPSCPQVLVAAVAGADAKTLDFTTPLSLTPGYYQAFASDPTAGVASPALWLEVQPSQATAPAKDQQFINVVRPLTKGQTLNGQFLAGRDPSGQYSDVDYYYFFATAGSTATLSLNRADMNLPWEHPDALDPQLLLIDPDGIVWEGFESLDNQPGADLNASLSDLVLPKTGAYTVYAATSKGFGAYQLSFSLVPVAPASGLQVVPAANNDRTVPLNTPGLKPMALAFDRRGHPLSGAVINYSPATEFGESGGIVFPNGYSVTSSTRGFAQVNASLYSAGKTSFKAQLQETGLIVPQEALVTQSAARVPRYRPAAIIQIGERGLNPLTGERSATFGRAERLELAPPEAVVIASKPTEDRKTNLHHPASLANTPLPQLALRGREMTDTLSAESITSCSPAQFRAAGVNAAQVQGPFTITLTDLTAKTGEPTGTEVIGVEGVHEHRVNKTIRMKIEIKDANGLEPSYPVLVRLSIIGDPPGRLILDPDGTRIECQSASFLWHERDAQGNIIAPNEEFEYRLTTRSAFVGVKPDPQNQGEVLPVWGTSEFLNVFFGTFDDQTGNLTNQFSAKFGVHPEAGKPDHFKWNPTLQPPPHRKEYLAAYDATFGSDTATFTNNLTYSNLYYLADQYDNVIYQTASVSATDPASNVDVTFVRQDPSDTTADPAGYQLTIAWNDNPSGTLPKPSSQWPNGDYVSTLTATGTDVEAGPFNVSQVYTAAFSQPTFYSLVWADGYDQPYDLKFDFSVNPPVPITFVSPGAARTRLNGELSRNSILLVTGTRLAISSAYPHWVGPPGTDPGIVDDGLDSFDVSLVDDHGNLVTDSEIQVAFCAVFDVQQRGPCPFQNRTSSGGVILGVRPIDRGYMGLMVSRAPTAPGVYFFRIKPVAGNTHQWRVGGSLDPLNNYTYTYAITVVAAELLDENLQRTNKTLNFSIDRLFYLREIDLEETADSYDVDLILEDQDTHLETTLSGVTVRRLGRSFIFMSDAISVISPDAPLQPLGQVQSMVAGRFGLLDIRSQAGTISTRPGRYVVKDRRNRAGTIVVTRIHLATTRLAEILDATPNFDGVTQGGPLGAANPARDRIEARVRWGADGYVATKLFNVDSDAIFTFDYWLGQPLTTDLRPGGLLIAVEQGSQEQERVVPSGGQFKALIGSETVKPGLYRIRAKWGLNAGSASSTELDPFCVTDRGQYDVCLNEWIVSVGQRIFLDAELSALSGLGANLSAVGDNRSASIFLDDVTAAVTSKYAEASGNVVVTRNAAMLRPYLRHAVRDVMTSSACGAVSAGSPLYGCTGRGDFPLRDPNADLAIGPTEGINRDHIYRGVSRAPDGTYVDQVPQQPRNTPPNTCNPVDNPCPDQIFFNRFVAVVAHETAHGFGVVSPTQFFIHGGPTIPPASNNCVVGQFDQFGNWSEPVCGADRLHEPILGEWLTSSRAEGWLLQTAPYRWHLRTPAEGDAYDQLTPPQHWLVFDRPMWFSQAGDYSGHGEDRSLERFLKERVPICQQGNRRCR
jgi:hypothetical protein